MEAIDGDHYFHTYYVKHRFIGDKWLCDYKGENKEEFLDSVSRMKTLDFEEVTSYKDKVIYPDGTWNKRVTIVKNKSSADAYIRHLDYTLPTDMEIELQRRKDDRERRQIFESLQKAQDTSRQSADQKELEQYMSIEERLRKVEAETMIGQLKQEPAQEKAEQSCSASHRCWQEQQTWWAQVSLFDPNKKLIQKIEGAHDTEKSANAWANVLEKMLLNVWIVQ